MVTRYLNTNSTVGGDGTTNATVGANRAWATAATAIAALSASPVADDLVVECCGTVVCDPWDQEYVHVTAAGYTATIRANQSVPGAFNNGVWSNDAFTFLAKASASVWRRCSYIGYYRHAWEYSGKSTVCWAF